MTGSLRPRRSLRPIIESARVAIETLEARTLLASVTATSPFNGQQNTSTTANLTVTFGSAMNATTLTSDRVVLRNGSGTVLPAALSYNSSNRVLTINPDANLVANSSYYTLRILGGSNGVKGTDGTGLSSDVIVSFTSGTPNITQQTVFTGLTKPTGIEFADDGRIYIAEQSGLIKRFDGLSDTSASIVADLRTNVHNFWDRGLLGMALDPQFTTGRPYIYVLYTYDAMIGGTAPRWGTVGGTADPGGSNASVDGAPVSGRLSKLTVGANGLVTNEQVLINDWANQFPSHSIGDLKFGPDGYLYASAGDGASFNLVDYGQLQGNPLGDPNREGGALRSQDILSSGDPTTLDGTVIRVDPDTGAAAPGNPFASSSDLNNRRIIAYGLRNPFRMTFRPGTNELYIADTGWNTWEEINRIANVSDSVVENFGWPAYEGPNPQAGYQNANLALLAPLYANPNLVTAPWYAYQHSQQQVPGSSEPTGGSSPTGIAFYESGTYPLAYEGAMFTADYSRQRVYVAYRGPNGDINQSSRQILATGSIVELTTGPGGDIFGVNLNMGTVVRFVATGYNRPPVASLVADRTTGPTPLTVNFDARGSVDPDGGSLWYAWDLDGDGDFDDSTSPTPTYIYTQAVDTTVRLRVTDSTGLSDTKSIIITPANTAPVPTITLPLTTTRWSVGDTINFAGSATDAEDGVLAASRLDWTLILVHGNEIDPNNTHEHAITSFSGVASGSFVAPDHESPSWLVLRLTATDSRGLSASTSIRVDPRTVILSFQTSPAGMKIVFNGTEFTAPFTRTVIANSANSIAAPSPQTLNGNNYTFSGWAHGGTASQLLYAPANATTYTANYATSSAPTKLTGTVIGTAGSWNNSGNTRDKAFDNDLNTFFDAPSAAAWTGLDLGTAKSITQIRFAPRPGWASRMVGGLFQASNNANFSSGVVTLHSITTAPAQGSLTTVNLTAGAAYRYVRYLAPADGYGNIAEAEFYTAGTVTPPTNTVPAAPTNLTAEVNSGPIVKLTWTDASNNETEFVIQRRYTNWVWEDLPITVAANATTASDTSAYASVSYEYRVAAKNAAGTSPWSNGVIVDTANITGNPPAAPSLLVATAVTANRIDLSWADNSSNETGFRIERRTSGGSFTLLFTTGANVRTYSDTAVSPSTSYEYRVTATDGSLTSGVSNIATATTPAASGPIPNVPTNFNAVLQPNSSVQLSWTDTSNNETGFILQRRYSNWIWEDLIAVGANVTSYNDSTGYVGVEYEWRVIAIGAGGPSNPSNGVVLRIV